MLREPMTRHIDPFANTFVYRCRIPLAMESVCWPLADSDVRQNNMANEMLLEVLTAKPLPLPASNEFDAETKLYLAQLQSKMDLMLNWMGRILMQQGPAPVKRSIEYSIEISAFALRIILPVEQTMACQQYFRLQLYLSDNYPEPLNLYAQVIDLTGPANSRVVTLRFLACSERFTELMERLIFKRHRSEVANSKKPAPSTKGQSD